MLSFHALLSWHIRKVTAKSYDEKLESSELCGALRSLSVCPSKVYTDGLGLFAGVRLKKGEVLGIYSGVYVSSDYVEEYDALVSRGFAFRFCLE